MTCDLWIRQPRLFRCRIPAACLSGERRIGHLPGFDSARQPRWHRPHPQVQGLRFFVLVDPIARPTQNSCPVVVSQSVSLPAALNSLLRTPAVNLSNSCSEPIYPAVVGLREEILHHAKIGRADDAHSSSACLHIRLLRHETEQMLPIRQQLGPPTTVPGFFQIAAGCVDRITRPNTVKKQPLRTQPRAGQQKRGRLGEQSVRVASRGSEQFQSTKSLMAWS